jgi:hypothetical protein
VSPSAPESIAAASSRYTRVVPLAAASPHSRKHSNTPEMASTVAAIALSPIAAGVRAGAAAGQQSKVRRPQPLTPPRGTSIRARLELWDMVAGASRCARAIALS